MRLSAPIQFLIIALTAQSSASPLAAPASSDVEIRDSAELASDTAAVVGKRSYQKSCTSCGINNNDGNPYLECQCSNSAGKYGPSRVYLNNCIANRNGVMVWARNGGFGASCFASLGIRGNSNKVEGACKAPSFSSPLYSSLSMDGRVHNQNGQLAC